MAEASLAIVVESEVCNHDEIDKAEHVDELQSYEYSMHPLRVKPHAKLRSVDYERECKVRHEYSGHYIELLSDIRDFRSREALLFDLFCIKWVV